jgi:hypothetical protein
MIALQCVLQAAANQIVFATNPRLHINSAKIQSQSVTDYDQASKKHNNSFGIQKRNALRLSRGRCGAASWDALPIGWLVDCA